jgi:uncharacterized protein (TIGR02246 family)
MAALFAEEGEVIGFDGSQMSGPAEIAAVLQQIFADHPTPTYVATVRSVGLLSPETALLHAVAGLVPRGQSDLNPQLNAIQTLVATKGDGHWRIALFQNTPAQFHGRPELAQQLTDELRQLLCAPLWSAAARRCFLQGSLLSPLFTPPGALGNSPLLRQLYLPGNGSVVAGSAGAGGLGGGAG